MDGSSEDALGEFVSESTGEPAAPLLQAVPAYSSQASPAVDGVASAKSFGADVCIRIRIGSPTRLVALSLTS